MGEVKRYGTEMDPGVYAMKEEEELLEVRVAFADRKYGEWAAALS
jgi:hypothetical protein